MLFLLPIGDTSMGQSQYLSALTNSSQRLCRESACIYLEYFEAIEMTVSISGNYNIVCSSDMDTYGYIYNNSFDLYTTGTRFSCLKLQSMTKYILVTTTYFTDVLGSFSIIANGPGIIHFTRLNTTGNR
jgi:hypothetical protein